MTRRASLAVAVLSLAAGLLLAPAPGSAQEPAAIVVLTIDTSGSIRPELLQQIKQLASGLLARLPQGSEVAVFSFNDQSTKVLDRTSDVAAVEQAVQGLQRAGRFTALYDALFDASRYLKEAPPARKAIVLVTDGKDENSSVQIEDGLKIAVESRIPVHCVGVGRIQEAVLRRIARLTEGEYAPIGDGLAESLAQRIAELPAPSPPPPVPTAVAPATAPAPVAEAPGSNTWLWLVAGSLVVVAAFGTALLLRRRPAGAPKPAATGTSATRDADGEDDDGADRTVVIRAPEVGEVERTVMLRLQPSLVVTRGPSQGEVFNLSMESAISIGRSPTNDIPVGDTAVSGEHCRIRPEGGAFVLHDLQSTNGTFVNEKRIERHRLSEGDVIRVGETQLQFRMGPA